MKRLVLIGNGFDLAHGLKTGYNDFMLWYLKRCFHASDMNLHYCDPLIEIDTEYFNVIPKGHGNVEELFDALYADGDIYNFLTGGKINQNTLTQFKSAPRKVSIKSDFFSGLLQKCSSSSWVEIENDFYEELKRHLHMDDPEEQAKGLQLPNDSLSHLSQMLEEYLGSLPKAPHMQEYAEIFSQPISVDDLVRDSNLGSIEHLETMFLLFNYTPTAEGYTNPAYAQDGGTTYQLNYIHGQIGAKDNPMVFGFGDELDADYAKMENSKIKGFFKHIKSFWYFRTQNYHKLIRFIESEQFQVYILGHSCGLSDRTMLNMIFEHPQCKSIKIFYYGNEAHNNFTAITEEISRHFKNKTAMRDKIVPFQLSFGMPQIDVAPA